MLDELGTLLGVPILKLPLTFQQNKKKVSHKYITEIINFYVFCLTILFQIFKTFIDLIPLERVKIVITYCGHIYFITLYNKNLNDNNAPDNIHKYIADSIYIIYNVIFFINSFFAYSGILSFDFKILTVEMEQTNNI